MSQSDMDEDATEPYDVQEAMEQETKEQEVPEDCGFTIIGEVKETKLKPTKVALPKWIVNCQTFNKDVSSGSCPLESLSKFISGDTFKKMKAQSIVKLFPVQSRVIPFLCSTLRSSHIVCPPDVCVAAPTGSGKTLTFVLPIVEYLCAKIEPQIRVLVVVPVGHLAQQIKSVFDYYCRGTRIKTGCSTGLKSLEEDLKSFMKQTYTGNYICSVDILVCTPGRLTDLMQRAPAFDLSHLELIVLDEADRIESNEMEHDWISKVETKVYGLSQRNKCFCSNRDPGDRIVLNACCPCSTISYSLSSKPIQKWLFSATLTSDPMKMQQLNLYRPRLFRAVDLTQSPVQETGDQNKSFTPSELTEKMIITDAQDKPLIIWYLLTKLKYRKVLCFTGSVENTLRLHLLLEQIDGIVCRQMSSQVQANEREKLLRKFAAGKIDILVCSDLMARGIDISGVDYVICYDPPTTDVAYIHRIGRTARAGRSGTAITLVTKPQRRNFRILVWKAHKLPQGCKFPVEVMTLKKIKVNNCKREYETALEKLPEKLREQKKRNRRNK